MLSDPYSLLPTAYRAAVQVVHNPVMAEEASERAIHQLTLAIMEGYPPESPVAWLRVVAKRSACAILRGEWARTRAMDLSEVESQRGRDAEASNTTATRRKRLQDALEDGLHDALTARQQDALHAATAGNTMRAAARTCGMQPRDFRRSIGAISRRARALQDREPIADRVLPGCEPGMAV